jgi:hypothetical protein
MPTLNEGQFQFEGINFGSPSDTLIIEDATLDAPSVVSNDTQNPFGNNVFMGRDRLQPAVWSFEIATNNDTSVDGFNTARALVAAWRSTLNQPYVLKPLYFCTGGKQQVVYGRPRRISGLKPDFLGQRGVQKIVAEFALADSFVYEGVENFFYMDLVPMTGGGLTSPFKTPIKTLNTSGYTEDTITVGGDTSAPFSVKFHGPITNPYVSGDGWRVGLTGTLAYDRYVVVDTRTMTATWDNGTSAASLIDVKSNLRTRLSLGGQRVSFGGSDDSYTAYAEIKWRNASYSI